MSSLMTRYPTPSSSPSSSDSSQANNEQKMAVGLRDLSNTEPLTAFHQPSCDNHTLTTHPQHLPPSPPAIEHPNEFQAGQIFGRAGGQVDLGTRGANEFYGGGQSYGYQQHRYNQDSWSEQTSDSWLRPTAPPPEAAAAQIYSGTWYASPPQHAAPQQSWWVPSYQQPLTQWWSSAAPQQTQTATGYPLNANSPSFTPSFQQNPESVALQALHKRLGIDKAARYSQAGGVPVPTGPARENKKKEKTRKTKREKALEKLAAVDEPDALTSLDLWARAPFPGDEVGQASEEKRKAVTVPPTAPASAPRTKNFDPRAGKRHHIMQRPAPTPTYLHYATQQPQTLDFSRPLLVILDLNGTLLYRRKFGGSNAFTPRPHVYEFLEYLFNNQIVMVWSSSKPENVARMCSDLFTDEQRSKLAAIWARDKLQIPAHAYNQKVQVYKQLSWVWNDPQVQASNPVRGGVWTQANTVLIDDSIEKSVSEPHNLIELEEFEAKSEQMTTNVLGSVAHYLDELRSQRDVSAYMRMFPFVFGLGTGSKQEMERNSRMNDIDELVKRVTGGH